MDRSGSGVPAVLLILLVLGGFGYLVWTNAQPAPELRVIVPTQAAPTDGGNAWQDILREGFGSDSTPLPTVAIPTQPFVPPTLPFTDLNITPLPADVVAATAGAAPLNFADGLAATPTIIPTSVPAVVAAPDDAQATQEANASEPAITQVYVTRPPQEWQPPPLVPPISRDPLGRDHYWLLRPVDSNANNRGLFYYPYGSDGPENAWRIHTGIDMPNAVGQAVRAAGSGVVSWAADGITGSQSGVFQNSYSYGNLVVIDHDFGYDGQQLFTLYAHLSRVLVVPGQYVERGDVIGLVGNTGGTTGPHVHFEVRLGENRYGNTVNPVFWMVPYVGTGVIAGRVVNREGDEVMDADVTIRNFATGLNQDTTVTYIYQGGPLDINPDPVWQENFVVGDVPAGRYEVIANVGGERVSRIITVVEGTTTFVELSLNDPSVTPQAVVNSP